MKKVIFLLVLIFSISAFAVPNSIDVEHVDQDVTIVNSVDQNIDVVLNFEFVIQANDAVDSKSDYIFESKMNGSDVLKAKTILDIRNQEEATKTNWNENKWIDPGRSYQNDISKNQNIRSQEAKSSSGGMPKTV